MEIDQRQLPDGEVIRADLCIIGAGPAGISIAHSLLNTGIKVILAESGLRGKSGKASALNGGQIEPGSPHPPAAMYRERRLGGTSAIWGGRCVPLDPIDFETREYVPHSGWPIDYSDVAAYYDRALALCEAGTPDFSMTALRAPKPLIEGFSPTYFEQIIERYSPPTDFGRTYGPALKSSRAITLLLGVTCVELQPDLIAPLVSSARFVSLSGKRIRVEARYFVLSVGGIETVRLLAASRARQANGMANSGGSLGRFYMCHIEGTLGALRLSPKTRPIDWGFGWTSDGVYARQKLRLLQDAQRTRCLTNAVLRLHHPNPMDAAHGDPILSMMYLAKRFILPEYRRKITSVEWKALAELSESKRPTLRHIRNIIHGSPELLRFMPLFLYHRFGVYRRIPYVALKSRPGLYPLDFNAEQGPDPDSRIRVGDELDKLGLPTIRVEWRRSDIDVRSIAGMYELLREDLARSGVGTLEVDEATLEEQIRACGPVGGHHIGTARMSNHPREGVTDGDGRTHDVKNLFISGSAIFSTSGNANPTLTIVALALRLAARLRAEITSPYTANLTARGSLSRI